MNENHRCRSRGGKGTILFTLLVLLVPVTAAEIPDPQRLVGDAIETLRKNVVRDAAIIQSDPTHAMSIVRDVVAPHVDMVLVSRLVLGKHWRSATQVQRDAFVDGLSQLMLRVFALQVSNFTDAEVEFSPTVFAGQSNNRAVVRTKVSRSGAPAMNVDYRLRHAQSGWKVYDVAIFGISMVKTYHITIDNDVEKHGLDGVIEQIDAMLPLPNVVPDSSDRTTTAVAG